MKQDENHNTIETPKTAFTDPSPVKEIILWWEKRRVIYNVLIVGLSIFSIYSYWDYPMRTIKGGDQIIIDAIVFIFGANLLYTMGWGFDILMPCLFKEKGLTNKSKWFLFILGTLFSLAWTNSYFLIEFDVLFADIKR
ncbi:MAG: hypothetical protein HRT69_16545 [Flavobacteriaceae bacterium]|nr:hypothetical protein [Flavobacteriaceae bacterium]